MANLATRLTERLELLHPVISAPMGLLAGGKLAAAVSNAGGLGLIGGGYGDAAWIESQFAEAGNARVGCGFITWALAEKPHLLDQVLERQPAALMLSFGDPRPFASRIKAASVPLICQVQSLAGAALAVEAGADIVVAQGLEAGGHSGNRSTFSLVEEVAGSLAARSPETLIVAAGGIATGRGLAAALSLGADGVLMGTRFLAAEEASVPSGFHEKLLTAQGDSTVKTRSIDVVRGYVWPADFQVRALRNNFVDTWHGREDALAEPATNAVERERYWKAYSNGDLDNAAVLVGEAVGVVNDILPARQIVERVVAEACAILADRHRRLVVG